MKGRLLSAVTARVDRARARVSRSMVEWVAGGTALGGEGGRGHRYNALAAPPEPGPGGKWRVHVGCGSLAFPGFVNVDARLLPHVHFASDASSLWMIADGGAEVLYASHVLEHVSHRRTLGTLREWARVLAPGGKMFVAVPDFDKIVERYRASGDLGGVLGPLMGEQDYPENLHQNVFTAKSLGASMEAVGLVEVRPFEAAEILPQGLRDNASHALSLNLVGVKR